MQYTRDHLQPRLPDHLVALAKQTDVLGCDAAGRYHKLDYRAALEPPLRPEDAAWAQTLLTAAGRG
jgi:hypothetical protein